MGKSRKIEFISKDVNSADETIIHWFSVKGHDHIENGEYGVRETDGEISYVDQDGCPIEKSGMSEIETLFHLERDLLPFFENELL